MRSVISEFHFLLFQSRSKESKSKSMEEVILFDKTPVPTTSTKEIKKKKDKDRKIPAANTTTTSRSTSLEKDRNAAASGVSRDCRLPISKPSHAQTAVKPSKTNRIRASTIEKKPADNKLRTAIEVAKASSSEERVLKILLAPTQQATSSEKERARRPSKSLRKMTSTGIECSSFIHALALCCSLHLS